VNGADKVDRVIAVCVPSEVIAAPLAGLAVEPIVWSGEGAAPDGLDRVEFLVPRYMAGPPPEDALAGLPNVRVVQLLSAGYETWLPLIPDGVLLCNGRGIHGASTAELAVGGLIALLRELPSFHDDQLAGRWQRRRTDSLDGKRVLVLGAGDIGARVATALDALGAETTLVARTARDGVRTLDQVDELLAYQDVVVVALPLTDQTHWLVDAAFLARLPDGACLVNVARGAIVDTEALLAELTAGRLRAFLDVTDPEPLPDEHPLWHAPNVLITPHVGGGTSGWEARSARLVREQVARYLAGEPLQNVV
jgi:phosphoglycerate dehydrogenase-like enzyme